MPGLSRYFNKKFFVLVNYSSEDGKFAEKAGINFHTLNSWIDKYRQCGPERKQFGVNQKENLIPISTIMEDNVLVAQSERETIDLMIDGHHIELDRKDLGVLFGALKHD